MKPASMANKAVTEFFLVTVCFKILNDLNDK